APADALPEVADDRPDPGVDRLDLGRDGVRDGGVQALEVGQLDAEAELRELLPAVLVAGGPDLPGEGRIEGDAGRQVAVADHQAGGVLDVDVGVAGRGDARGRRRDVVRPVADRVPGPGVDPVVRAEVEGAGQGPGALLLELLQD